MKKILTFGSINVDFVLNVDELPLKGQSIHTNNFQIFYGGKGANQAVAIVKMGTSPTMFGNVGDDANGSEALIHLEKLGLDINQIRQLPNTKSGVAVIIVDRNADNVILINPGANEKFSEADLATYLSELETHDLVLTQLETNFQFTFNFLKEAKRLGKTTILNPAPAVKLTDDQLQACDFIIPNETELAIVLGEKFVDDLTEIERQAVMLQEKSQNHVIVTLGKKGSLYVGPEKKVIKFPAFVVDSVDPTAAGDTFIGVFTKMFAEDVSIEEAINWATAAAALTVTKPGAQVAIPTKTEVENFLKKTN